MTQYRIGAQREYHTVETFTEDNSDEYLLGGFADITVTASNEDGNGMWDLLVTNDEDGNGNPQNYQSVANGVGVIREKSSEIGNFRWIRIDWTKGNSTSGNYGILAFMR